MSIVRWLHITQRDCRKLSFWFHVFVANDSPVLRLFYIFETDLGFLGAFFRSFLSPFEAFSVCYIYISIEIFKKR